MESSTQSITAATVPFTTKRLTFLTETLNQIDSNKQNIPGYFPNQYFADKNAVLNTLLTLKCLLDPLLNVKHDYDRCKATEPFTFHDEKHINGIVTTVKKEDMKILQQIKTDFGTLTPYQARYGDTEWQILATNPEERAFVNKVTFSPRNQISGFLKKHLTSDNNTIKAMASNYIYLSAAANVMRKTNELLKIKNLLATDQIKKYFAHLNLKSIIFTEQILAGLASAAFSQSGEAAPSIVEKLTPLCTNKIFSELYQENPLLGELYRIIIKNIQKDVYEYATKLIKQNRINTKPHILCNNDLLPLYFSIAPELKSFFASFGYQGLIPGIMLVTPPEPIFVPKPQPQKRVAKKAARRGATQPKKIQQTTQDSTPTQEHDQSATSTMSHQDQGQKVVPHESPTNDIILYDNRVIEQNNNKKDLYNGFTLMTVPHIIKHGTHSLWHNKTTGNQDNSYTINGELEYTVNGQTKYKLVTFTVCIGADGAIYHIEMRKTDHNAGSSYTVQFPPLGTTTKTYHHSHADEYGSRIIAETDYMIQIVDGGLVMGDDKGVLITLYK